MSLHFDSGGRLWVTSTDSNTTSTGYLESYDPSTGARLTRAVAGAPLTYPAGFAFDAAGDIDVLNSATESKIYRFTPSGALLSTVDLAGANVRLLLNDLAVSP